jgi:hypothetical protein
MMGALGELPLKNKKRFIRNRHDVAAAESYLRRSLEALFDIGRHILVKSFAFPATEYKEIARGLQPSRRNQASARQDAPVDKMMALCTGVTSALGVLGAPRPRSAASCSPPW